MIHDEYFEDPFPINISTEDLQDCYMYEKDNATIEEFSKIILGVSPFELSDFWKKMVEFYMKNNFTEGVFGVIPDAHDLVENYREYGIFDDLNMDLSHLDGMTPNELQLLVIPFNNIEELEYFGETMEEIVQVDYWGFGELIGKNCLEEEKPWQKF